MGRLRSDHCAAGLQISTCVTQMPMPSGLDENATATESPFLMSWTLHVLPSRMTFASAGIVKSMVTAMNEPACLTLNVLVVKLTTSPRTGLLIVAAAGEARLPPHPPLTMGVPTAQMSMTITSHAAGVSFFIGFLSLGLLVEPAPMMPRIRPPCNEFSRSTGGSYNRGAPRAAAGWNHLQTLVS